MRKEQPQQSFHGHGCYMKMIFAFLADSLTIALFWSLMIARDQPNCY